jgi:mono/diheme cytochrome c family protein
MTTFDQMAQSIAGYEASAEVTPFTSKFDAVLAMTATFTAQERLGYDPFRGKARCNECHRDGGPGGAPAPQVPCRLWVIAEAKRTAMLDPGKRILRMGKRPYATSSSA